MKKTESHSPVFKGYKVKSTTVCAYCPKCGESLKNYLQDKCDKCGWDIDWQKVGIRNDKRRN